MNIADKIVYNHISKDVASGMNKIHRADSIEKKILAIEI
jgi:hypothetical protein